MTRLLPILAATLALAAPAARAGPVLDGPGFEAATRGQTFEFSFDGVPYGAEQYLPDHKVLWSFLDGRCLSGEWRAEGDQICFAYEDRPGDFQCWQFQGDGIGLRAQVVEDGAGGPVYTARPTGAPLYCMGPDVGA